MIYYFPAVFLDGQIKEEYKGDLCLCVEFTKEGDRGQGIKSCIKLMSRREVMRGEQYFCRVYIGVNEITKELAQDKLKHGDMLILDQELVKEQTLNEWKKRVSDLEYCLITNMDGQKRLG